MVAIYISFWLKITFFWLLMRLNLFSFIYLQFRTSEKSLLILFTYISFLFSLSFMISKLKTSILSDIYVTQIKPYQICSLFLPKKKKKSVFRHIYQSICLLIGLFPSCLVCEMKYESSIFSLWKFSVTRTICWIV